jgi:DNA polymerase eta
VTATKAPKSLMAAKAFTPAVRRREDLQPWFSILSVELYNRIMRHFDEYGTWPKTISLRYATPKHPTYRSKAMGTLHKDEMKTYGKVRQL